MSIPTIVAQLDFLGSVAGVVVAVLLSFVVITLVSSYYRFQGIVLMAEDTHPEDMGASTESILRVQLARYLAGCARRGTSFSIALFHASNPDLKVRMDAPLIAAIKQAARRDDITCIFDDQTAVLLAESEPEDALSIFTRIVDRVSGSCAEIASDQLRVGVASYPGHGLSGKELIRVALDGLAQASLETPIVFPKIIDFDEEDDEETSEDPALDAEILDEVQSENSDASSWKKCRKSAMLDELTGVLNPSAVSAYMQRTMSDLRQKKKKAALFCIGVNNIDHISRFHGEEAADDVLVGVSKILQDNLRVDDLIGRHEKSAFIVLMQCSFEEAEMIGKRISTLVQNSQFKSGNKKIKTTITLGMATYPEHGRNLNQLYAAGQKVLNHSRSNDIRSYAVYDPEIHDKVFVKPIKNIKSIQA